MIQAVENSPSPESDLDKKLKSSFNFGKCKVCKDKATGIHYGVASCEGCKVLKKIYIYIFFDFFFFFGKIGFF